MADPANRRELREAANAALLSKQMRDAVTYGIMVLPPGFIVSARMDAVLERARLEDIIPDLSDDEAVDRPDDPVPPP